MKPPFIAMKGVTKTYGAGAGAVHALRGVDLEIRPGEFVSVTGPSGSGKTTLMNLVGCLDSRTGGSYTLEGVDVGGLTDDDLAVLRNRTMGFVFQNYNLIPELSVAENVALPLLYARRTHDREYAVRRALSLVGLEDLAWRVAAGLSGGEQQRAAIARALVNDPSVVLADEPTGSIDRLSGALIMNALAELNAGGHTIVLVTHNPSIAARATRVVALEEGVVLSSQAA